VSSPTDAAVRARAPSGRRRADGLPRPAAHSAAARRPLIESRARYRRVTGSRKQSPRCSPCRTSWQTSTPSWQRCVDADRSRERVLGARKKQSGVGLPVKRCVGAGARSKERRATRRVRADQVVDGAQRCSALKCRQALGRDHVGVHQDMPLPRVYRSNLREEQRRTYQQRLPAGRKQLGVAGVRTGGSARRTGGRRRCQRVRDRRAVRLACDWSRHDIMAPLIIWLWGRPLEL
jgi:hypothetical protein